MHLPYFTFRFAFAIALLLVLNQFGFGQNGNNQRLQNYLEYLHSEKGFSGEILIAQNEDVQFHEAIGFASRSLKVPLAKGSKYNIASISKTFTGALIKIAEKEEKISLDDLAQKYLEHLGNQFKQVTIEQLLTHTSGIPHNEAIENYWQEKSRLSLPTEKVIHEINQLELLFRPGTKMKYSSLGYYLLASILEKTYQKPFQQLLDEKIYAKAGMSNTSSANTLAIIEGRVNGYHQLPNDSIVQAPYRNYSMLKGAGDQVSTAIDLLKWNNSFRKETLFNQADQVKIFNDQFRDKNYGYGWYTDYSGKDVNYYHGGGTWGYSSYNAFFPASGVSIIVLSNLSTLPMNAIAKQIETILNGEKLQLTTSHSKKVLPEIALQAYEGTYASSTSPMQMNVMFRDKQLFAQIQGRPGFLLTPTGKHKFLGKKIDIELEFNVVNGQTQGIIAKRMGQTYEFKKQ
ncbi:serine hydrolase domain-containing protein [Roseivirga sp.]|uniref:serine hydrolase domain-containing protein n=1 Tax=Roseivirga sp. TaxID=1964215 RepID=UPI003B8BB6AD